MKIEEYDDETLLEEVKHRGFKIKIVGCEVYNVKTLTGKPENTLIKEVDIPTKINIGGIEFELTT